MFKLTFVILAVIWTVSSAVVGKDLGKDTAKKTKFNLGEFDKFLGISTVEMEFLKTSQENSEHADKFLMNFPFNILYFTYFRSNSDEECQSRGRPVAEGESEESVLSFQHNLRLGKRRNEVSEQH